MEQSEYYFITVYSTDDDREVPKHIACVIERLYRYYCRNYSIKIGNNILVYKLRIGDLSIDHYVSESIYELSEKEPFLPNLEYIILPVKLEYLSHHLSAMQFEYLSELSL